MKLFAIIGIVFLSACANSVGQSTDEDVQKEQEFKALIEKSKGTNEESSIVQQQADNKTNEIITKTVNTIVTLKDENQKLKEELNEATHKIDSISYVDPGVSYELLPISGKEEDR